MNDKDNSAQLEDQKQQEGPFSPKQMRLLKWSTSIMGVLIVICVILLGIGLSRQAAKLSDEEGVRIMRLDADQEIHALSANGSDGFWLYSRSGDDERVTYYSASGKQGAELQIVRD